MRCVVARFASYSATFSRSEGVCRSSSSPSFSELSSPPSSSFLVVLTSVNELDVFALDPPNSCLLRKTGAVERGELSSALLVLVAQ